MKLYLVGPMSGIKSFNYPAFEFAADYFREQGFDVMSPTHLDSPETFAAAMASPNGVIDAPVNGITYEEFVAKSIARILFWEPDALVALPGWSQSSGTLKEKAVAESLGVKFFEVEDYDPILGFPTPELAPDLYTADGKFIPYDDNPLRQRTVTGGVKDNRGKAPVDLVPWEPILGAAGVLAYGAAKYKPNNWRLGLKWSETWSSLQRHLWAWKDGEDLDPETGLPHLDHAMCQLLFLSTYYHDLNYAQFDDRWVSSDQEAAKA